MDTFDFVFTAPDVSPPGLPSALLSASSPMDSLVAPVVVDATDMPDVDLEQAPADFDHRSSGFGAYCVIG
ncbi:hypothetical protein GSI_11863 [Ganoderma sinense ZZ0214-1]|uniref:Pheromone n=1 Tax=Ganoderma sinense ZZ0214-1 TaxID=1077348 RepID=A0A2G8RX64_9APHY|nr:hypothetical protein GSI_11863 [Ganoderma sinense ZZ0214-1]